jgi:hypothetical protein
MIAIPRRWIFDRDGDLKSSASLLVVIFVWALMRTIRKLTVWVDATIDEFRVYTGPHHAKCASQVSSYLNRHRDSRDCDIRGKTSLNRSICIDFHR